MTLHNSGFVEVSAVTETIATVHIVDDDEAVREALSSLLRSMHYEVQEHNSASAFLEARLPDRANCIILDVRLPGTSGLELQDHLSRENIPIPVILMTGFGDIQMSVRGMKAGAVDFLTKPFRDQDMLDAVASAISADRTRREELAHHLELRAAFASLSMRERQVMDLVVVGKLNKQIAGELALSEVTVKVHRAGAMRKMKATSVAQLARMAEALAGTV